MFLGDWNSIEDLIYDFNEYEAKEDTSLYEGIEILLAYYLYEEIGRAHV